MAAVLPRQRGAGRSSTSAYAKYRPLEEMRALHDYAFETERGASRRHPRALDPHRPAARGSRRRDGAARAASTSGSASSATPSPARCRRRPAIPATALLRAVHRGRHSGADLRRHHRARRRPARRRRRDSRLLPSAPSRSGCGRAIPSSRSWPRGPAGRGRPR